MTDAPAYIYKNWGVACLETAADNIVERENIKPFFVTETMRSHPEHKRPQVFSILSHPLKDMRRARVCICECCIRDV